MNTNKFDELFNKIISEEAKREAEVKEITISKVKSIIKEILTPNFAKVKSKPYGFDLEKMVIKGGDKKYLEDFQVKCEINENDPKSKAISVAILKKDVGSFIEKKHKEIFVKNLTEEKFTNDMKKFLKF